MRVLSADGWNMARSAVDVISFMVQDTKPGPDLQSLRLHVRTRLSILWIQGYVQQYATCMHEREIRIEGMTCQHCVLAVQKALNAVPGITLQVVRIGAVVYSAPDTERVLPQVRAAITEAGYTPA